MRCSSGCRSRHVVSGVVVIVAVLAAGAVLRAMARAQAAEPERFTVSSNGHPLAVWARRPASPRAAVLVLKEAWYPGWSARIDGAPAPCLPANVWARAVRVPAGRHEVRFVYRQRWLREGAVVSALCALLLLALFRGTARPRG